MSPSGKAWTAGLVGALIGIVVGGGATLLVQQQQVATLKAQLVVSNAARVSAEHTATDAKQRLLDTATAPVSSPTVPKTTPAASVVATAQAKPKPKIIRQFAFVKKITKSGSKYMLLADYAEYLTGKPAAAAAKARGDESPPPNDYYIVNDNKLLRTLPLKSTAPVTLTDKADGTSDPSGYGATVPQWATLMSGPNAAQFKADGYWLTITDGTVTAVVQQWVP